MVSKQQMLAERENELKARRKELEAMELDFMQGNLPEEEEQDFFDYRKTALELSISFVTAFDDKTTVPEKRLDVIETANIFYDFLINLGD